MEFNDILIDTEASKYNLNEFQSTDPDERPISPKKINKNAEIGVKSIKSISESPIKKKNNYEMNTYKICINIVKDSIESTKVKNSKIIDESPNNPILQSEKVQKFSKTQSTPVKIMKSQGLSPGVQKNFLKKGSGHKYDPKKAIEDSNNKLNK